jgi:YHS domain-containing protein
MLKLVLLAAVVYILYRFFINDKSKLLEKAKKEREERSRSEEMVQDPVCGTYVDKSSAISVRSGEQVLYFCSYECRKKYIEGVQEQKKID